METKYLINVTWYSDVKRQHIDFVYDIFFKQGCRVFVETGDKESAIVMAKSRDVFERAILLMGFCHGMYQFFSTGQTDMEGIE